MYHDISPEECHLCVCVCCMKVNNEVGFFKNKNVFSNVYIAGNIPLHMKFRNCTISVTNCIGQIYTWKV
jgi:hypothetical protein